MSGENTSFVTLMDGAHQLNDNGATVVSLVHPNTNELQHFILSEKKIYEMTSLSRPYGSFFLGSRVISNGALNVVTRMDPLYFVLHTLSIDTKQQQWQPLDQLDIDSVVQDALAHDVTQYQHVCAVKKLGDDLILYKFNPDKALTWLVQKQEQVYQIVQEQMLHAKQQSKASTQQLISQGGGAFSNTFHMVPTDNDNDTTNTTTKNTTNDGTPNSNHNTTNASESSLTRMELQTAKEQSVQIVCDYLSLEWQTKLLSHLKMNDIAVNDKDSNNETATKKRSRTCWETTTPGQDDADNLLQFTMGIGSANDAKEEATAKKQQAKTAGLKRLAKVNTKGMKSLSSFFGAPKKKKTQDKTESVKD